jgi:nucleotide-binding universal stress UspA family protein
MASPIHVGVHTRLAPRGPVDGGARVPFTFGRIVCAVNDSRSAQEAVHQATQLTGSADTLTLVAVTDARGAGPAAEAVEAARAAAEADGIEATTSTVHAQDVGVAILEAARDAGLLVLGAHGESRMAGILLGSATRHGVQRTPVPILVARGHPELGFPGVVLVGTQGIEDRHAAVVAATIAARYDTRVVLAHAGRPSSSLRHALAEQASDVLEITGRDPMVVSVDGPPVDRLPAMARSVAAGLVVLGSQGRRGPHALANVSERVARRSTCSVLVLRRSAAIHQH